MAVNIGVNIQRSPNRINQALRAAGVNGQYPKLLFDFDDEYYLTNGSSKTFANAMTFARAGLATMVDSDGLIKWAPHNIFTYSEDFSNAVWVDINGTLAVNSFTASNDNNAHYFYQDIATISPTDHTVSFEIKAYADAQYFQIAFGVSDVSGNPFVNFDLLSGTITADANSVGTIVDVGDGWYRCEVSVVSAVSSSFAVVGVAIGSSSATRLQAVDASALNLNYGIRRAHLYRSDLGGMVNNPDRGDSYVPTTSSAVYLPRRGHHKYNGDQWVNKGILVESEARTNLVPYSQETTGWTASSGSFTNNAATAPDGTNTAFLFTASASTAIASARTGTFVSSTGTHSVYIKNNGMDIVSIWIADGNSNPVIFDLTTGTIVSNASQFGSIEDVGNGWYRISNGNTSVSSTQMRIYCGTGSTQTNNGTDGFYLWGAQVEAASTPSSYIPTNGASVTRAAETVTVPYANLPWPTPTYIGDELVTNGTFDTDSDWTLGTGWSISGGVVSADGSQTTFVNAEQRDWTIAGRVYQFSITVTSVSASYVSLYVGGSTAQLAMNSAGTYTGQVVATNTNGAQIQASPDFIGSIDNISVKEINPLSVSIAMMGEYDFYQPSTGVEAIYPARWFADSNNAIYPFYVLSSSTYTGRAKAYQAASGVNDDVQTSDNYYPVGLSIPFNAASRHGSTFVNLALEGVALTANTTPVALPDLSTTDLNFALDYMGTVSSFRIWDRDIGDTGIAEATKPSLEPSLSLTFDGQPSSFTNTGLTL